MEHALATARPFLIVNLFNRCTLTRRRAHHVIDHVIPSHDRVISGLERGFLSRNEVGRVPHHDNDDTLDSIRPSRPKKVDWGATHT